MHALPPNVLDKHCEAREFLAFIANKWTILILIALKNGRLRNAQLMQSIEGISQKMLTQRLRELEAKGLIYRHDMNSIPPHVEYELSPLGASLQKELLPLERWIETYVLAKEAQACT